MTAGGFGLVDTTIALAVMAIGVLAMAAAMPVSGHGLREGRYASTAMFLAEERLEQVRAALWDAAGDCLGTSPGPDASPATSACTGQAAGWTPFPDEPAGTLRSPFEPFGRTVRVQGCETAGACPAESPGLRLVTITVSYAAGPGISAPRPRPVLLRTLLARAW